MKQHHFAISAKYAYNVYSVRVYINYIYKLSYLRVTAGIVCPRRRERVPNMEQVVCLQT